MGAMLVGVLALGSWSVPALATTSHRFAEVQVSRSFEIPITNPATGRTIPSVLVVRSVRLDSKSPDGSGVDAPTGKLYLSLTWSSGPVQRSTDDPLWGSFYSGITAIPGSAVSYVTTGAKSYPAVRTNPVDQLNNPNADTNDGLVDATYYFLVPASNRAGTIVVSPTTSLGTPYVGFVGASAVTLNIGGPTRIAVRFPKDLTVSGGTSSPTAGSSSSWPWGALVVVVLVALVFVWRRRSSSVEPVVPVAAESAGPAAYGFTAPVLDAPVVQEPVNDVVAVVPERGVVRIDVLGALRFDPPLGKCSDPARAFLAYLAMHPGRPRSVDDAQTALYPITGSGKDVTRATFINYVSEARRAIGAGHLPEAGDVGGYRLVEVRSDWEEFTSMVQRFATGPREEQLTLGVAALALVRDRPFVSELSRYFEWIHNERIVSEMQRVISDFAHSVSTLQIRAGDLAGAEQSLRKGLLVAPASTPLWEQLTDVMLEHADQSVMAAHWQHAEAELTPVVVTALRRRETGL